MPPLAVLIRYELFFMSSNSLLLINPLVTSFNEAREIHNKVLILRDIMHKFTPKGLKLLDDNGCQVVRNPYGTGTYNT